MKDKTKGTKKEHRSPANEPNLGQKEAQQEQHGDRRMGQMGGDDQQRRDKPEQQK